MSLRYIYLTLSHLKPKYKFFFVLATNYVVLKNYSSPVPIVNGSHDLPLNFRFRSAFGALELEKKALEVVLFILDFIDGHQREIFGSVGFLAQRSHGV